LIIISEPPTFLLFLSRRKADTTQLLHADMKFDPTTSPHSYRSGDQVITKGTKVRMEIVGCKMEAMGISAIGTVKKDYLGPIDDDETDRDMFA
jgi:DNA-directed RNA polymerase II subunit RPB7